MGVGEGAGQVSRVGLCPVPDFDLGLKFEIAELEIPAYHQRPSSPTNLTLHQTLGLSVPIRCGDVAVFPGDIMVGDDDCVIVILVYLAEEIAEEAVEMTAFEDFVVERVRGGASIIGLYPPTKEENQEAFAQWKMRVGR